MENFEKYYTSAVHYLTSRPRSVKEVRDNLLKKYKKWNNPEDSEEVIDEVIRKLLQQKFLDDVAFALWWREQRTRFRAKSDRLIKMELIQKGIARDIIEKAFAQESEEIVSDYEKAKRLIEKRLPKLALLTPQERFQKLAGYLGRRGFDYETIKRAIDDSLRNGV